MLRRDTGICLTNYRENVILFENQIFFAVELELGAAILGEQHTVALAHIDSSAITVVEQATTVTRDNSPLLGLLSIAVTRENAALLVTSSCAWFDDHTVTN